MKKLILSIALCAAMFSVEAKTQKATFTVGGACEMCKERIENAATAVPGVTSAKWSVKTKQLVLIYDDKKTSVKDVQKAIAAVGHDAGDVKAPDAVYDKLHGCCKYR